MPPYKPVTSRAQARKLWALAREGKVSVEDAKGKTGAAAWGKLPERVGMGKTNGTDLRARLAAAVRARVGGGR